MISGEDYKVVWQTKMSLDAWKQALNSLTASDSQIAAGYCRDLVRWCQTSVHGEEARHALAQVVTRSGLMSGARELQTAVNRLSSGMNALLLPACCC